MFTTAMSTAIATAQAIAALSRKHDVETGAVHVAVPMPFTAAAELSMPEFADGTTYGISAGQVSGVAMVIYCGK